MKNLKTNKTVATWLPLFPGFYDSWFDGSESFVESETSMSEEEFKEYYSDLYESGVTYVYFKNNFYEYTNDSDAQNNVSENVCDAILKLEHAGIIQSVKYDKLVSPKYYNYSNDSINCDITFNTRKLTAYLRQHLFEFNVYITETYTSRSGFSSHYSNDLNDWLNVNEYGAHEVGAVLNFVLLNESDDAVMELLDKSNVHEAYFNAGIDREKMIRDFNKNKGVA